MFFRIIYSQFLRRVCACIVHEATIHKICTNFTFLWWWCWEASRITQHIRNSLNQIGIIGVECYPSTLVNVQNPWSKYVGLSPCYNLHSGSIKRETQTVQLVDNSLEGIVRSTNNDKVSKVSKLFSLYQHFLVSCTQIDDISAIVP